MLIVAAWGAALSGRALSPVQEAVRMALSLSDNQMALLQGPALALPVVLVAIPLGLFIDRYSRVRLLFILAIVDVIGSLLTASAARFSMLVLARSLVGLVMAAITVTVLSLVADLYPPAQRGRAKGLVVVGQYAGFSVAFALGGKLLSIFDSADSWRWATVSMTGPILIGVALLMLTLREPPRTGIVIQRPSTRQSFAELWSSRAMVLPLMGGIVLAEVPVCAILSWAAPALSRNYALTPERIGTIMGATLLLSGVLGPLAGGAIADLSQRGGGPKRTVVVLGALAVLCSPAGLFALMPSVTWAAVLLVACTTISAATAAVGVTLFTIVVPNEIRGLCLAILASLDLLVAFAAAPVIVSLLSGALGGPTTVGQALAAVCVTASLLCAATFWAVWRSIPRVALL